MEWARQMEWIRPIYRPAKEKLRAKWSSRHQQEEGSCLAIWQIWAVAAALMQGAMETQAGTEGIWELIVLAQLVGTVGMSMKTVVGRLRAGHQGIRSWAGQGGSMMAAGIGLLEGTGSWCMAVSGMVAIMMLMTAGWITWRRGSGRWKEHWRQVLSVERAVVNYQAVTVMLVTIGEGGVKHRSKFLVDLTIPEIHTAV